MSVRSSTFLTSSIFFVRLQDIVANDNLGTKDNGGEEHETHAQDGYTEQLVSVVEQIGTASDEGKTQKTRRTARNTRRVIDDDLLIMIDF